jgi:NAD(P)-dependent dehydrogenase (short-subunit alcohol dehydrogenase family)
LRLTNKTALITGGNSGIGLATAQRFADEGASVFITGRREPELSAAAKEIGSVYNDTKAAVRSFARTWTMDLKDRRIRVNAVSPALSTRAVAFDRWGRATHEDAF